MKGLMILHKEKVTLDGDVKDLFKYYLKHYSTIDEWISYFIHCKCSLKWALTKDDETMCVVSRNAFRHGAIYMVDENGGIK